MTAVWHRLFERFWTLPAACCVLAFALGLLLPEVDERYIGGNILVFGGGPDGARSLLSAIVTSMISVTGLVFSITVVSLQLASSQFSPRVLRSFLDSRITQLTLGLFAGTFLYSLVVLREVRGDADVAAFVPQLSVTGAFVLVVAAVAQFVVYIHHITNSIRVVTIIGSVGKDTRRLIDALEHDDGQGSRVDLGEPDSVIISADHGTVTEVRRDVLVRRAAKAGVVLVVVPAVGDFVATGMPLVRVHGDGEVDEDAVRDAVRLESERSMQEDAGFGFRQLVDIAERALSPGINDPTTAVQVLDEVHELLRRLAAMPDPGHGHDDDDGRLRPVVRRGPLRRRPAPRRRGDRLLRQGLRPHPAAAGGHPRRPQTRVAPESPPHRRGGPRPAGARRPVGRRAGDRGVTDAASRAQPRQIQQRQTRRPPLLCR